MDQNMVDQTEAVRPQNKIKGSSSSGATSTQSHEVLGR